MNLIQNTLKAFLKKYNLDNSENVYLVGFSGGYDSVCLLHALSNACSNKIIAIHLNHNWRGDESNKEEENCRVFCKKLGVDFYSEKLSSDVKKNETSARFQRYNFFEKCAEKFNSKIIFTAHNMNDNAETLIYRIAKGTGIKGLCGITSQRGIYYRPLLQICRNDIEKYCEENNLPHNSDSSNEDIVHKRNLIRKTILPEFYKINSNALNSFTVLAQNALENEELIQEYLKIKLKELVKNGNHYDTKLFLKQSCAFQYRLLYEIISPLLPMNYDRERISLLYNFILNNSGSKSGKICSVTTGYSLYVSEKYFEIIKNKDHVGIYIPVNISGDCIKVKGKKFSIIQKQNKEIDKVNKNTIYADLSGFDNLVIRTRLSGDIIQPCGMKGHQKLKKYLNERKIPNHEKDELLLLASKNEILWVIGIGISEKIRVKNITTHKLEIEEENGN